MRRLTFWFSQVACVLALASSALGSAHADDLGCKLTDSTSGPPRQILTCDSGPVIEAETKADVHVVDPNGSGKPEAARVSTGAVLVTVPPHYPGGFQILTPRAIASVRGTTWVVDAEPAATSVFVVTGQVAVRRVAGGAGVLLHAGQGTDVGDTPRLRIQRWSKPRAAALLARFGR